MKLYKLTQTVITGYDVFDSCVVAARTAADARRMHPDKYGPPVTDATQLGPKTSET